MGRTKRLRLVELDTMDNVVDQRRCDPDWFQTVFGQETAVTLELGCGHGEYTLALARCFPDRGALGVDRNGARLSRGAGQALAEGLSNAHFIRSPIEYLEQYVPPGRVGEIWIPFPDPLPKHRQARRRLLAPGFLDRYRRVLRRGGTLYLKTDDVETVAFAERGVRAVGGHILQDGRRGSSEDAMTTVQTTFEKRYRDQGRTIYERRFALD